MGITVMRDKVDKNSSRTIVTMKNKSLTVSGNITTTPINIFISDSFFRIIDDLEYDLISLKGDWGVADDPVDENVRIVLAAFALNTTLNVGDGIFEDSNFWQQDVNYRAVGTPANVLQTLNYVDEQLENDGELFYVDPNAPTNLIVGMAGFSSTTSIVFRHFRLWWSETYVQRSFSDPTGEWSGYTDEEINIAQVA